MKVLAQAALCLVFGRWLAYLDGELFGIAQYWWASSGIVFWTTIMVLLGATTESRGSLSFWTIFFCLCGQFIVLLKFLTIAIIVIGYDPTDGLFNHTYTSP